MDLNKERKEHGMKRRLGTVSVFAICTGAMFSSGFFLLPGLAAAESGPALPLVYLAASILILPAIFSIAELSAAIPRAGGPYLFLHRGMGPLMGIIGATGKFLQLLLKGAFAFVGAGAYLGLLVDVPIEPVAIGSIVLFTLLNLSGVKQTATTEIVLVSILLLLLGYFVVSGVVQFTNDGPDPNEQFRPFLPFGIQGMVAAVALIFVSYGGIGQIASLAEEIKEPSRSIPKGMLIALGVATFFYFFGTAIMISLLPADVLRDEKAPVAAAAEALGQLPLPVIVVVIAALAAFASTGNAAILSAARYPLALARDGLLWKRFGKLDDKGVPKFSVLLTGAVLVLLVIAFDVERIAKLASAFLLFVFVGMCAAVIIFRESRIKEYDPGYRSPLYPWMQIFGLIVYSALIIESGIVAILLLVGLCVICSIWYFTRVQDREQRNAAIHHLFGRMAAHTDREAPVGQVGIPMLGGIHLAELVDRGIVLDLDQNAELDGVMQRVADALTGHIGGDRDDVKQHLLDQVGRWRTDMNANIAVSPVLLEGIEQPEMVIVRGPIETGDRSYKGLIVLVDDKGSSDRSLKLLSQLEGALRHSDLDRIWQNARDDHELKEALKRDMKHVQAVTVHLNDSGATAEVLDRELRELDLPDGSLVAMLQRNGRSFVPNGGSVLRKGDRITIIANEDAMKQLVDRFEEDH